MLINWSNHPSSRWSERQREQTMRSYGRILDKPFPEVSPQASTAVILHLAEQLCCDLEELIATHSDEKTVVHLMGEMTLTFALVSLLQRRGINCVASTSRREVATFQFIRYREYPKLNL